MFSRGPISDAMIAGTDLACERPSPLRQGSPMTSTRHDVLIPGPPRVQEVGEGVFAYLQPDGTWWINNTGFLVGSRGVISVDSCSTVRRTRAYLDAISGITTLPVRTLVNTHHHGDHTHGNWLFGGATIVGHERTRSEVLAAGKPVGFDAIWTPVDWGELELAPPFLTYTDGVTLWSDDRRLDVRHVGAPAHTTNDSYVWLPDERVLFCGDLLFNGGTPFVLMGSVTGALDVLERVVKPLGAGTIVPGHGPVGGPELVDTVAGYLRWLLEVAERGRAAGLTPLEAARETDLGDYAALTDSERIVGNLHRAYADLDGDAQVEPVAALLDMVAFNGGRPLRCLA
jgi:cyclase